MTAPPTLTDPVAWPNITVMVPAFNQAQYLVEAVESVLAQDYPNLDVVISDDASSDDTPDIAQRLARDPRVKFHRSAANLGRVANYRYLLGDLARGDWVLNLDGDDCLASTSYLRTAMTLALSDPGIVMVFAKALSGPSLATATTVLNAPTTVAGPMPRIMDGTEFFLQYPPFETIVPLHATCLYHRASALRVGFYTRDILSSDFESLYRLMLGRKIGFIDEVAALWRQHGTNATQSRRFEDLSANIKVFDGPYRRAVELGALSPDDARHWLRRCQARYLVSLAAQIPRRSLPINHVFRLGAQVISVDWKVAMQLIPALTRAIRHRHSEPTS
jgi:hypothetical protein